jgi:hypothetical protein
MVSVPSQRTNKLCAHEQHRDRSAEAAIFANGTYFVDTTCIFEQTDIERVPSRITAEYTLSRRCSQFHEKFYHFNNYPHKILSVMNKIVSPTLSSAPQNITQPRKFANDINLCLEQVTWTGFIWLRIWTSGELL